MLKHRGKDRQDQKHFKNLKNLLYFYFLKNKSNQIIIYKNVRFLGQNLDPLEFMYFKLMPSEWKRNLLEAPSKGKAPITRIYFKGNFFYYNTSCPKGFIECNCG